jgi:hypothetical protein
MPDGQPCPARDRLDALFLARPGKAEDLAEAQRLGGIRRKRERTIAAACDVNQRTWHGSSD